MPAHLSADELRRWTAWKRASDTVWAEVTHDITAATGLSAADFSVLTRVVESRRPPRQQDVADELGWSRSRVSRQVARMEERGLLVRDVAAATTLLHATEQGRRLTTRARAAHATAVRRALLSRVDRADAAAFWSAVDDLGDVPGGEG